MEVMNCLMHFFQAPDLATEDEYWDLWEAVKVDDIDVVMFILTLRSEISAVITYSFCDTTTGKVLSAVLVYHSFLCHSL